MASKQVPIKWESLTRISESWSWFHLPAEFPALNASWALWRPPAIRQPPAQRPAAGGPRGHPQPVPGPTPWSCPFPRLRQPYVRDHVCLHLAAAGRRSSLTGQRGTVGADQLAGQPCLWEVLTCSLEGAVLCGLSVGARGLRVCSHVWAENQIRARWQLGVADTVPHGHSPSRHGC